VPHVLVRDISDAGNVPAASRVKLLRRAGIACPASFVAERFLEKCRLDQFVKFESEKNNPSHVDDHGESQAYNWPNTMLRARHRAGNRWGSRHQGQNRYYRKVSVSTHDLVLFILVVAPLCRSPP
jgi:hypothetical protein